MQKSFYDITFSLSFETGIMSIRAYVVHYVTFSIPSCPLPFLILTLQTGQCSSQELSPSWHVIVQTFQRAEISGEPPKVCHVLEKFK